ncbi:Uncharacterized protein TCM_004162 [Theobroma cacao]|uniref:HAT C-terminal dimerisation domain-containing protein n=1 Tax=Theobroma cacao TaxID=3641 RepID=A0A061DR06_THECC|nr:Uncharacterized protein TCM_004162 [Theobroma cacao]
MASESNNLAPAPTPSDAATQPTPIGMPSSSPTPTTQQTIISTNDSDAVNSKKWKALPSGSEIWKHFTRFVNIKKGKDLRNLWQLHVLDLLSHHDGLLLKIALTFLLMEITISKTAQKFEEAFNLFEEADSQYRTDLSMGDGIPEHEDWENVRRYPTLALLALDVLAIPPSIIASESAFSTGGHVLDAYRSSLMPKMVQALICAQDWLCGPSYYLHDIENDLAELEKVDEELSKIAVDNVLDNL